MNVSISLQFPQEILLSLRESDHEFVSDIMRISAADYYVRGKLSLGQSALLAGMNESDFIKYLSDRKISIFDHITSEELNSDFTNA